MEMTVRFQWSFPDIASYTAVVVSLPLQAEKKEEHFKTEPVVERVAQKKKTDIFIPIIC